MIRRIVKMHFKKDCIEEFKAIYASVRDKIESQPGCYSVELMKDINDPCIMFTYSIWEDKESLDAYRNSNTFKEVWPRTKALFDKIPEAWSLEYADI